MTQMAAKSGAPKRLPTRREDGGGGSSLRQECAEIVAAWPRIRRSLPLLTAALVSPAHLVILVVAVGGFFPIWLATGRDPVVIGLGLIALGAGEGWHLWRMLRMSGKGG